MKKRRILRAERGFTLVELGIVMAIIAILAAVAYPTYTGMRNRAYIAEAKAILQEIRVEVWASKVEDPDNWPVWSGATGIAGSDGTKFNTDFWTFGGVGADKDADYVVTATPDGDTAAKNCKKQIMNIQPTSGKAVFSES